ncbi:uncharacterized protein EV422DRAFT_564118 [Fimicolochytrium jonesii]|uniref:uncharacterized protein n=1 Tax=Fimicolochytrium jonesii TaxID=1396493 RepID=UPI0022FE6771|nr:uncharacterized protein EV422DRAFT_564118 [Fimicolochytrium jonesii]KAI8824789.1 hypothetical protein EV422DRAFT_564118 [Fimicolochytrium jonesii]
MWCMQYFIILFLVPFPRAPNFFLLAYLFCLFISHKPCLYCSLVIFALLASSCNYYTPVSGEEDRGRCWVELDPQFLFTGRGREPWGMAGSLGVLG